MTGTLIDMLRLSAERVPRAVAIVQNGRHIHYDELWNESGNLARFLTNHGVHKEDRVALLMENSLEYAAAYYGVISAGAVVVALNVQAKARDLVSWLRHSGANWLIVDVNHPELIGVLEEDVGCEIIGISHNSNKKIHHAYDWGEIQKAAEYSTENSNSPSSSDLAQIIYTSGTTGAPKGVMLSHGNLFNNVQSILKYLNLTADDSILNVLPFYYSYGNSVLHTHLAVGAKVILENSLAYPHSIIKKVEDEQVTGFSGVPSTYALLLNRVQLKEFDLSQLRYMTQAGGGMPSAHIKRLQSEIPHIRFFVMYGQTEATARIAYLPPEKLEEKMGAVGIAIPGVTMELHDEHGDLVEVGEIGEIWVSGANIMQGYWKDCGATALTIHEGWLKTGDLARQDADGYFFIVGRSSDMIKSGAHRISPMEIEQVILELDGVAEAAVVGVPDEILGEVIKAVIVPRVGCVLDGRTVKAHCHQHLALYKVPKQVEFTRDLPKTASGKVKRYLLAGAQ